MGLASYDLTQIFRPVQRVLGRRFPRLATFLRRLHYDLRLLAGDRLWLFVVADLFLVSVAILESLTRGMRLEQSYAQVVVMPALLLGVPALSSLVSLERRAGSLDLALAAPSTTAYFLRRAGAVGLVLWVQAIVLLSGIYVENQGGLGGAFHELAASGGALLRSFVQATLLMALLLVVSLFWAVRLRSGGAVMVASALTLFLLSPWTSRSPVLEWQGVFFGVPRSLLGWLGDVTLLLAAAVIFFLYARERLRRPHLLLD